MLLKNSLLNKKSLLILLVFVLILSLTAYAARHALPEQAAKGKDAAKAQKEKFCETDEIEQSLKKILYQRLTEPDSVPLTLGEIKDLLSFYLNIGEDEATARCSEAVLGYLSKKPISSIINAGINLPDKIPVCSDGTKYGECSYNRPMHCTARGMVDRCQKCGCPTGSVCAKNTGKCESTGQDIACSTDSDCGKSEPDVNYYCSDNYITRDFINYTCEAPGTVDSRCVTSTSSITLEYCDPDLNKVCVDGVGSCKINETKEAVTCSDGTQDGQCSATKPLYCREGSIMDDCSVCGCPTGRVCSLDGGCIDETTPSGDIYFCDRDVQITADLADQRYVNIYEDKIVWQDWRNYEGADAGKNSVYANIDIYMYDLSTGKETQITDDGVSQGSPAVYGSRIVWTDYRNGAGNADIYMYDLSTGRETQITTAERYQGGPDIYKNKIVWGDQRDDPASSDIYMYDLATGRETKISTKKGYHTSPSIYGNRVVWQYKMSTYSTDWDIYMHDLSTGQTTLITKSKESQTEPDIYEDKVVWRDYRNGNYDIYMYDISTGKETQITTHGNNNFLPRIHNGKIVWTDYRSGSNYNPDIYLYDISTGKETQITTSTEFQWNPAIYGNRIAWVDKRNGNYDVYITTISDTDACPDIIVTQTCSDGTENNQCSANKPFYCRDRDLLANCGVCGCSAGEVCSSSGACVRSDCLDGTLDGQCSATKPFYCRDGTLVDDCNVCGCPTGAVCSSTGACAQSTTPSFTFETMKITEPPSGLDHRGYPRIYDNIIVWMEGTRENFDVYMHDLSTKKTIAITNDTANQHYPDAYGNIIAWSDERHKTWMGGWDIYTYDISKGDETRRTTNQEAGFRSQIYGDKIVYGQRYGPYDGAYSSRYFMYDLTAQQQSRIPVIGRLYNNKLYYADNRTGNLDIYMYNLLTGQETQITNDPATQAVHAVYGDKIVWQDYWRTGNFNIFMYDLTTGKETQLSSNPPGGYTEWLGNVDIQGNRVVWQRGNCGLSMYDISLGLEVPVEVEMTRCQTQPSIYGNKIAWEYYDDIFMTTISTTS